LSEREAGHLPPAQIIEAAEGVLSHAAAKLHLDACEACRGRVELWQAGAGELAVLRARPQSGTTGGCPSMEDLANYSAGAADEKSGMLLDHLAQCGRCAAIMTDALDTTEPEVTPALRSSGGAWQREMAATFARKPKRSAVSYWRYAGIAAAVVIVSGAALWWKEHGAADPAMLLAKAYTEARPFEYRLADQGYGPIRQERGSGSPFNRPESLASAEAEIQRRLAMRADDPELLALKGRAQLLERDYEGAIESLSRASESKPDDPELLSDLGTAYAVRGETEKRNIDYGHALDLFLRALKKQPTNQRDLFNLALTYEHLWLVDEALDAWTALLRSNPGEGWRHEAEIHLSALEKIMRERKKAEDDVLKDPAAFLARTQTQLDFDPDVYHDTFWSVWLPAVATNPDARDAAKREAVAFQRRSGDHSLTDILATPMGVAQQSAIARLVSAIAFNQSGQTAAAMSSAREAAGLLDAAGLVAGAIRAREELAYAWRRTSMNRECLDLTEREIRAAESRSYLWLAGRAHIEHAGCAERLGQSGIAREELVATESGLRRVGLRDPALRALGFITAIDRIRQDHVPVWTLAPPGLAVYWSSSASPNRAQEFQYSLQESARNLGWKYCAVAMFRAEIRSIQRAGNLELEALNRFYLAGLFKEMGDYPNEIREYDEADKLFRSIKPGPTLENLVWNAKLARVEAEIAAGHAREIMPEIERLASLVGTRSSLEQIRVQQALGLAFVSAGNWRAAVDPFQKAVSWNQHAVSSLRSYADRIPAVEPADVAYRNLTQIELRQQGDPRKALETWTLYETVGMGARSPSADTLSVTYAILPAGVAVWLTRGTKIVSTRFINAPMSEIESACHGFLRLCATPSSDEREIKQTGNRLFRWLIEPELKSYSGRNIGIRTDSWLASIPFGALTDDSGDYLIRRYSFIETTGPGIGELPSPGLIRADASALLVSVPSAKSSGGVTLPALASAETEVFNVSRFFGKATLLSGEKADAAGISAESGHAEIFHFAGHGWADGGNGALALPAGASGEPRFLTSRDIARQNWSQCSLAVLSACLTAAGEGRGAVNNQGLVRAMLSAGAHQVIAARWSIDSLATCALMERFYAALLSGRPAAAALVQAALQVRDSAQWRHPYYWAAFDVFGN
jgi:CHAT domain-containing protein/tetratricopeptide (TPR) repeat protein